MGELGMRSRSWGCRIRDEGRMEGLGMGRIMEWVLGAFRRKGAAVGRGRGSWMIGTMRRCMEVELDYGLRRIRLATTRRLLR